MNKLRNFTTLRWRAVFVACIAACRAKVSRVDPVILPAVFANPSASAMGPSARSSFYDERFSRKPTVRGMTELGRLLFYDPELSASRSIACVTCHDPRFAYGPPNALPTQPGGPDLKGQGIRAVPALRYLQSVPPFSEHHFDEAVDESVDQGPTGGHAWDGRADTLHEQARVPLTSPFEMANDSVDSVVAKVTQATYAAQFRAVFGDDVFGDAVRASTAVLQALEVFQQSAKDFYPYSSRYDAWLRGRGQLSAQELAGLALFNDRKKGNCASCHPSQIRQGSFPQFTDFGYVALGVPRNPEIQANRDPKFFDLGLCGPLRTDLANHGEYCGEFRVPTLRNVAVRRAFFHNGVFHRLGDVVRFYAERDTQPAQWYRNATGKVNPFDDLPVKAKKNVNREPPLDRRVGQPASLNGAEIQDVVAFLETLTDEDLVTSSDRR